jgi:tripartite ATP-independent transporter DctM subunit
LRGSWSARARWFSFTCAAAIAAALALAGWLFVSAEREGGQIFAAGVPLWVVQCILPVGFGVIALRLLYQAAAGWPGRFAALVLAGAFVALATWPPLAPTTLMYGGLGVLLVATVLGAPIFAVIGGLGLLLFWGADVPIASMSVEHYRLTVNPALPSIPLFTLAGYLMAEGGASRRLLRVFSAVFGSVRGGPAIAVVLICAFFTAFTGGSGVTILALGGLLMPILLGAKFSERDALGLVTGAGSLGILLPPCLPVILYAIIARVDIREMFLGGFLPGILLIAMTAAWGIWSGRRETAPRPAFDGGEALRAVWAAKWELLLPVVSLAALFGGWATPVEAAALTAAYAFVVEVIIHRDLHLMRDVPRVAAEAGLLIGGILLILGVALGLTNYLIDAQVPDQLAAWSQAHVHSRWLFLLGLNFVLIGIGSLVEIYAAIIVAAPLLVPIGLQLGINPIHLGVLFLANMELGFLAPPIGLNLLLASYRLKKPVSEVTRATFPLLVVMFLGVLLITYFEPLTTWLPSLLHRP